MPPDENQWVLTLEVADVKDSTPKGIKVNTSPSTFSRQILLLDDVLQHRAPTFFP